MVHVGVPCLSIGAFDYVDCVDEAIEVVSLLDDGFILIIVQVCWFLWWKQNKIAKHRTCHLFLVTTLLSNNWWQRNPRHPLRDLAALNSALPFTPPLSPVFSVNHQHVLFTASRQHQHQQHVITIKHDINHIHHHHYLHNSCPLFQENRQDESITAPPYLGSLKTISTFSNDSIEGNIHSLFQKWWMLKNTVCTNPLWRWSSAKSSSSTFKERYSRSFVIAMIIRMPVWQLCGSFSSRTIPVFIW